MTKSKALALVLTLVCALPSFSQGVKLTAFGGYTFQDKVYGYYANAIIREGAHFGGVLSYEKSDQLSIDLTYSNQQTTYDIIDYYGNGNSGNYKGAVNYIMLGASHSPSFSAKVAPYGGIMLGTAIFTSKEKFSDEWRFAIGGKLGAAIHLNERFGIVLQGQLMLPVQGVGASLACRRR